MIWTLKYSGSPSPAALLLVVNPMASLLGRLKSIFGLFSEIRHFYSLTCWGLHGSSDYTLTASHIAVSWVHCLASQAFCWNLDISFHNPMTLTFCMPVQLAPCRWYQNLLVGSGVLRTWFKESWFRGLQAPGLQIAMKRISRRKFFRL